MSDAKIKEIRKKVLPLLKREGIVFAGVFGSTARGSAGSKSDIDLLVRFQRTPGLFSFIRFERELSDRLHRKVDLVTEQSLSPHLRDSVLRDLKVIHE